MATTDSNGLVLLQSTDIVTPLHTVINSVTSSVSNFLTANKTVRYVTNTAARTTLATSYAPTATNPLIVWRGDAMAGRKIEYTTNGTNWYYLTTSEDDSGWVNLTPANGTSSGFSIRRIGQSVAMRGAVVPTTSWGTAGTVQTVIAVGGLDAQFRPATTQRFICPGTANNVTFNVLLGTDGSVLAQCNTSSSATSCWFPNVSTFLG